MISPEPVLQQTDSHAEHHVVAVVELHQTQIPDVGHVDRETEQREEHEDVLALGSVQTTYADDGDIEAVQDGEARGEVVETLGEEEVAGVEDRRPDPRVHPD
ncbi:hypothetical protein TRICI_000035 [Trichomonascus ciferrii]|uniref:Uncharacterized protein n=1 Tax=Trichomonascus ciferrii TaxID=44093 RepID=A0A642VEN2_9ASCO|nr:hypothetical protein TRICI_000035 [Trichomonascus ciferrii]